MQVSMTRFYACVNVSGARSSKMHFRSIYPPRDSLHFSAVSPQRHLSKKTCPPFNAIILCLWALSQSKHHRFGSTSGAMEKREKLRRNYFWCSRTLEEGRPYTPPTRGDSFQYISNPFSTQFILKAAKIIIWPLWPGHKILGRGKAFEDHGAEFISTISSCQSNQSTPAVKRMNFLEPNKHHWAYSFLRHTNGQRPLSLTSWVTTNLPV